MSSLWEPTVAYGCQALPGGSTDGGEGLLDFPVLQFSRAYGGISYSPRGPKPPLGRVVWNSEGAAHNDRLPTGEI